MSSLDLLQHVQHESLEVGAAPLVRHFLERLNLFNLFDKHLAALPGRQPALPSSVALGVLLTNLLIARQPLYAIPAWVARRVPEHLGLRPDQLPLLNDDRIGRALDHLHRSDRASLLTALVTHVVREFDIDLSELHQDTTTVTFHGNYADQPPAEQTERPPRITFGYNKDHRPDLKQLLYSITISDDGAVPVHCKIYDGNTTDDQVHQDTWSFLRQIIGHANFLYVADSKLCTRDNMHFIADRHGRFLTVMPRTRTEDAWFRNHLQKNPIEWQKVHEQADPRKPQGGGQPITYHGVESPQRSSEGYRVLWYRSSQKEEQDRQSRQKRLEQAREWLEGSNKGEEGGRRRYKSEEEARAAAQKVLQEKEVSSWLRVRIEEEVTKERCQEGPGRPGPKTRYQLVTKISYRVYFDEEGEALERECRCDGLFPLMTNDKSLGVQEALLKYKYQPFVEKRHEQLKSGFAVMPMWLKNVGRVESLLWLYYVVELLAALVEREVSVRMEESNLESLALYPEGRPSHQPTTGLVFDVLEGHRRHRLLSPTGVELRRFHDSLSPAALDVLRLLDIDGAVYGLE
jgi:transposase